MSVEKNSELIERNMDPAATDTITPRVILVIGKTASGKSALAVDIALRLKSIVISADAFQVYRDLRVASDKITSDEMRGVRHFGIDLVEAYETFTVKDFLDMSIPLINSELSAGRSPIIVGGTNMYIEKLIFTSRLDEEDEETLPSTTPHRNAINIDMSEYTYERLLQVDPIMAEKIHKNDFRRISRAIEFFEQSGVRMSDKLKSQSRQLRWENLSILCKTTTIIPPLGSVKRQRKNCNEPSCDQLELRSKIRNRVHTKMIQTGALRDELDQITILVRTGKLRWNKGILQAIGYREFQPFVESIIRSGEADEQLFTEAVEAVIKNTIKYARQQGKWITRLDKYLTINYVCDFGEIFPILKEEPIRPVLKPGISVPQWQSALS